MRVISDEQRRARLGVRHALAQRVGTVEETVEAVACLHSTEPPSPYLSAFARAEVSFADVEQALYADRSVVKQLAMRRTLFVFPREVLPAVWGSASARVAAQVGARLAKEVEANGLTTDGAAWVARVHDLVLASLAEHGPSTTAELRERHPELSLRLLMAPGKAYGGEFPVAPRVLTTLAAGGEVLRGTNAGDWRSSRPRWTLTEHWLDTPPTPTTPEDGWRVLVERWLRRFGPGTEADLVWWLGATKGVVRRALADLGAVQVALEDGRPAHLLPDDVDDVPEPEPWAALLPVLDPTVMGWKERDFHLHPEDRPHLFDTNGNAGTTAWWCGRAVGCWVQDPGGVVSVVPSPVAGTALTGEARARLDAEADRLTAWLDGRVVSTVYPSPLVRAAHAPT